MKKIFIYIFSSLSLALLFSSTASADVLLPDYHYIIRCVRVMNLNEYPDVVLIGHMTGPSFDKYEKSYQINNNECLEADRFSSLSIYWTTKEKFNSIDLKNLNPADVTLLLDNVDTKNQQVDASNPLRKEDIEYSIAGFSSEKLIFYKSKQTSEYLPDHQKKVETFSNPLDKNPSPAPVVNPTPSPEPAKRGFWQSIACFFRRLFGKSCQ
jgi:hypothetical protein